MHGQVVPVLARLLHGWAGDAVAFSQEVLLVAVPQGGQAGSRRNAWSAMAGEAALAAARRESEEALGAAWVRARARGHLHPAPFVGAAPAAGPPAPPALGTATAE